MKSLICIIIGSGGPIRTDDLWVMSPTSYQAAPPRNVDFIISEKNHFATIFLKPDTPALFLLARHGLYDYLAVPDDAYLIAGSFFDIRRICQEAPLLFLKPFRLAPRLFYLFFQHPVLILKLLVLRERRQKYKNNGAGYQYELY